MGIMSLILKFAAPLPEIESFDSFLFIGPHPDDIEIGAGATVAKLASMGRKVSFLICLDGRFGMDHMPEGTDPLSLAAIREKESLDAAKKLGVSSVHFLRLSDGGFYDIKNLEKGMAEMIGKIKPDIIFAPDPCVTSECHKDHLNVGETARRLAFFAPIGEIMARYGAETADIRAIAYYMTAKPNRFVGTNGYTGRQTRSILCHRSQLPEDSQDFRSIRLYLKLRSVIFGIRSLKGRAEGFRVLGRTHMHCLPEAGR